MMQTITPDTPDFLGFRRANGRPGIRNYLLILNLTGLTAPSARRIARDLQGSCLISMDHGLAISGRGETPVDNTIRGLARHPNAGAVLILSAHQHKADELMASLSGHDRPIHAVTLDQAKRDALTFRNMAVRAGAKLLSELSRQRRERMPWCDLFLALECGMSDPSSSLFANPIVGHVTDHLISAGGAAIFGETLEWLGSEDALSKRAVTADIGDSIKQAVKRRVTMARESGVDLMGNNPNKANIAAGLTTIEDKAIGSVIKSGSSPVKAFLEYGDRHDVSGLAAMDGPCYTPESLTGLIAAGAQMSLFTSGVGNSFVGRLAPSLKITANRETAERLPEQFDFCCADAVRNPDRIEQVVDNLIVRICEVASGALTFGEILGEGDEVIARFGETL